VNLNKHGGSFSIGGHGATLILNRQGAMGTGRGHQ
jgi:hypothetical protein